MATPKLLRRVDAAHHNAGAWLRQADGDIKCTRISRPMLPEPVASHRGMRAGQGRKWLPGISEMRRSLLGQPGWLLGLSHAYQNMSATWIVVRTSAALLSVTLCMDAFCMAPCPSVAQLSLPSSTTGPQTPMHSEQTCRTTRCPGRPHACCPTRTHIAPGSLYSKTDGNSRSGGWCTCTSRACHPPPCSARRQHVPSRMSSS